MSQGINEQQVAEWLAANPDFFSRQSWLLEKLYVPHQSGTAVSLVERQTSMLRAKAQTLQTHLSDMIDAARHNDGQFEKTKRMVLSLLEADGFDEISIALEESLCGDFSGDEVELILFSDTPLDVNNLRVLPRSQTSLVQPLIETNLPSCGQFSDAMTRFLFRTPKEPVRSVAAVPLVKGETLGLLVIGSYDPHYFQSSQGTVFLAYIGEVLSRILARLMGQSG